MLVSAAILAAGCLALVQALTTSLRAFHALEERYMAALAVDDAVWTMDHSAGAFDVTQVQTPAAFEGANWGAQTSAAALGSAQAALNRQAVTLSWTSSSSRAADHFESFTLSGYYEPDDSAAN